MASDYFTGHLFTGSRQIKIFAATIVSMDYGWSGNLSYDQFRRKAWPYCFHRKALLNAQIDPGIWRLT